MRRRLDDDGKMVLARWLNHYQPDQKTRSLIAEAIEAYGDDDHQLRFYYTNDHSNPGVKVIQPQEGLMVSVRTRNAELFTLVGIVDERKPDRD